MDGRNKEAGLEERPGSWEETWGVDDGLSAPNPPFFACVVIPELDCVISPLSDGSLLGSVNGGSGGTL